MYSLIDKSGEVIATSDTPPSFSKEHNGWVVGEMVFTDVAKEFSVDPAIVVPPTVGAIAFMRLFTSDERVKARDLRNTDQKLDDFWRQLEDPRTDVVVMALPSIQKDIEYTLEAVKVAGLDINVADRKAEILSGRIL